MVVDKNKIFPNFFLIACIFCFIASNYMWYKYSPSEMVGSSMELCKESEGNINYECRNYYLNNGILRHQAIDGVKLLSMFSFLAWLILRKKDGRY